MSDTRPNLLAHTGNWAYPALVMCRQLHRMAAARRYDQATFPVGILRDGKRFLNTVALEASGCRTHGIFRLAYFRMAVDALLLGREVEPSLDELIAELTRYDAFMNRLMEPRELSDTDAAEAVQISQFFGKIAAQASGARYEEVLGDQPA